MIERRQHPRKTFEFLVLEHRPANSDHPQGNRVLECLDFSLGGMRIKGKSRFQKFEMTLTLPHDEARLLVAVEVMHADDKSFGVRFVKPSDELVEKISWWFDPDRKAGSVA